MAKTIGKVLRLRKSRLDGDDECLYCLPAGFVKVLLDMSERLTWAATWLDDNGNRAELSEDEKSRIELGIERLTMACEVIINNNITVEPPVVTVTNSCGDGSPTLPTLTNHDGTTVEVTCLPVNPDDPFQEQVPTYDEVEEEPPDGFEDWTEFVNARCRLANYVVDSYVNFVEQSDKIENDLSLGATVLEIAAVLILLLVPGVGEVAGLILIAEFVAEMAAVALVAIEGLESVNDTLQIIADVVTEHKQEFVCALYSASGEAELQSVMTALMDFWVSPLIANQNLSQEVKDGLDAWAKKVARKFASWAASYALSVEIPDSYVPTINCNLCGGGDLGGGWLLVPLSYNRTEATGESGGVTGLSVEDQGSYVRCKGTAVAQGNRASYSTVWSTELLEGLYFYGYHMSVKNGRDISEVSGGQADMWPGYIELNECDTGHPVEDFWGVSQTSYIAQFEADTGITINVGGACVPDSSLQDGTGEAMAVFIMTSQAGGYMSADIKVYAIARSIPLGS